MIKRFFLNEKNIMVAILLNAGVIFLMYFPGLRHNRVLEVIDQLFIAFYIVEAVVKMWVLSPRNYFSRSWNRFDFAIVVLSLPSLLVHVLPIIPDTSLLLLLRLFRLFRLLRFVQFIPHLNKILSGLGRALRASVFVLAALFFLNFMLAIFTCHLYGRAVPEYFGDPLISAYSIFQLFTIEGWNEISEAIADHTEHPVLVYVARFYIGFIVLIGGIFGMSLANAVFVDEMTLDNNRDLEGKIDELRERIDELKLLLEDQERIRP